MFGNDHLKGNVSKRPLRAHKAFEILLDNELGDQVRADGTCGSDLWSALANICWHSPEGENVTYSFRQAGDVVAWIREEGSGEDWYCSGEPGIVSPWIAETLSQLGWRFLIHS